MMKRSLVLAVLLITARLCVAGQTIGSGTTSLSPIEEELMNMSVGFHQAVRLGDMEALESLVADDYQGVDTSGMPVSKSALLLGAKSVKMEEQRGWPSQTIRLRIYGEAAVASGFTSRVRVTRDATGKPLQPVEATPEVSYTDVFVRRQGRWQVVASQVTRIAKRD